MRTQQLARRARTIAFFVLILAFTAAFADLAGNDGGLDLTWNTVDGGGGKSAGGTFTLDATIGQPDAGAPLTGGSFELLGGFWAAAGPTPTTCTGDISPVGGDGMVNVNDLLVVIGGWGPCPGTCPPACTPDVSPPGGDCQVNVNDLLVIIGAWGACP